MGAAISSGTLITDAEEVASWVIEVGVFAIITVMTICSIYVLFVPLLQLIAHYCCPVSLGKKKYSWLGSQQRKEELSAGMIATFVGTLASNLLDPSSVPNQLLYKALNLIISACVSYAVKRFLGWSTGIAYVLGGFGAVMVTTIWITDMTIGGAVVTVLIVVAFVAVLLKFAQRFSGLVIAIGVVVVVAAVMVTAIYLGNAGLVSSAVLAALVTALGIFFKYKEKLTEYTVDAILSVFASIISVYGIVYYASGNLSQFTMPFADLSTAVSGDPGPWLYRFIIIASLELFNRILWGVTICAIPSESDRRIQAAATLKAQDRRLEDIEMKMQMIGRPGTKDKASPRTPTTTDPDPDPIPDETAPAENEETTEFDPADSTQQ